MLLIDKFKKINPKKKVTNSALIKTQYSHWLLEISQAQKFQSLLYNPSLRKNDYEELIEIASENDYNKGKYSLIGCVFFYSIYFFGLKNKWYFYKFVNKKPSFFNRVTRRFFKFIFIPFVVFNLNYMSFDYMLKDAISDEVRKRGLYEKYNVDFLLKNKKF